MRRLVGIIIFVIGVLLVVLGVTKVLPGAASPGAFGCLVGIVVFGLGFIPRQEPPADAPPPLAPAERITGVFYEPARIFANLHFHPRWLAAFLVIALASAVYHVAFRQRLGVEVIALAPIEKTIESGFIPADQAERVKEQTVESAKSVVGRVTSPLTEIGGIFLFLCFIAAIFLLLAMIFGGRLTYWQALCVAVYSSLPPIVIDKLLSLVLLYIKAPEEIDPLKGQRGLVRADLGILFSPADHPYLFVFGSMIGLLTLYGLWLEATGLRHAGEKISSASAWTIALLLWAIGLVLALIAAALFPAFVV
jgi:hypothetical protein